MGKKRKARFAEQVPEALRRLFEERARTLSATLTSLFPSSPPLIRRRDSSHFRNLLNRCFLVLSQNSPPLPTFSPVSHWPQQEIVARTIEIMMYHQSVSSNVLCSGYDKYKRSSLVAKILTGPEWCLLLERVGEEVMVFILRHTSIFLPITRKKYHQVAGPPITELCFKMSSKQAFDSPISSSQPNGPKTKSEIGDNDVVPLSKRRKVTSSLNVDRASSSIITSVGFSCDHNDKHSQKFEAATLIETNMVGNSTENTSKGVHQNSNPSTENFKKRSRPFRWQRPRKHKQLNPQESPSTCLEIKVPRHVPKQAEVNKRFMFYNLEVSSSALPRGHILNSVRPSSNGAMSLLQVIFGLSDVATSADKVLCFQHAGFSHSDSTYVCLYQSLIKWLKILIRRAQNSQHSRLLSKHCVVQIQDQNAVCEMGNQQENESRDSLISNKCKNSERCDSEDIKSYCLKNQVVSFIWAACRSIVPPALLGNPASWRKLTRNINKFVQLRRFEKFSLKQCMHKLKASEFPFLLNKSCLCCSSKSNADAAMMKQRLLESWIYWFFSNIVVPLLQANFYVTETENGRQDVFYYRKSVWAKVKKRAITDLKDRSYVYLDNATTKAIVSCRRFGFSKLRLLPKENGLRLLANLKAPSKLPMLDFCQENEPLGARRRTYGVKKTARNHYFKPVNSALRDLHAVLKGIQLKEPKKLGSSVFDYGDVYKKLCSFLIGLKSGSLEMPVVYLIASDVVKAYDSVDQDKLLCVMKDLLRQETYTLKQSSEVLCSRKALWVRENFVLLDQNIDSGYTSALPFRSADSVLVNQERLKLVKKEELLFNLNEHVKHNVLQLDKTFYLQRVGICQGSILSSLLCSLYYGDMENKVIIPFLERVNQPRLQEDTSRNGGSQQSQIGNSYVLLRFIDDFLFISTSKQQAESFLSRLSRGIRDYNCYMNKDKYCVNFDISAASKLPSNGLCFGEDGSTFLRWSGLLINCRTLEVQADYTRYLNSHLKSSLTISWQGKPGHHLKQKLCGFMRPKCYPLFYDSNINSAGVVRLNIFQAFLLCAMKFHCYFRDLSYICKLRPRTYLSIIEHSFRYMHLLIKKRMCSHPSGGSGRSPILRLDDGEVEWLGLNAYIQVLHRKQTRHKKLLLLLKSKLLFHDLSWTRSSELDYAVEASRSSSIWKIKY